MKKYLSFLMVSLTLLTLSLGASAQTRYNSRNNNEQIAKLYTTVDAVPKYIDSIKLSENETGLLEVYVIGYAKDTAYSVRGKVVLDFNKRRGTLTIGTLSDDIPRATDAALTGATFTVTSINNNLYVRITGKAATTMRWYCIIKLKSQSTVT